jgi:hypothetical protein
MKRALIIMVAVLSLSNCATQKTAQNDNNMRFGMRFCSLDPPYQDQNAAWSRWHTGENIQVAIKEFGNPNSQDPNSDPASPASTFYVWTRPGAVMQKNGEKTRTIRLAI